MGGGVMDVHPRVGVENVADLERLVVVKLSAMQCRSRCGGVWATRSPKKVTKLSLLDEFVTHPEVLWTLRAAKSTAVSWRCTESLVRVPGWPVWSDCGVTWPACRLLVDRPHHGVLRWVQVEATHVGRLGPKVRIMAGHHDSTCQGLRSSALQIRQACDARSAHVFGHGVGQRLHGPARRAAVDSVTSLKQEPSLWYRRPAAGRSSSSEEGIVPLRRKTLVSFGTDPHVWIGGACMHPSQNKGHR